MRPPAQTILEIVDDGDTMEWVFQNLIKWEHTHFPSGCWYLTKGDVKDFKEAWGYQQYFCIIAWTLVDGKREMSGFLSWWLVDRGTSAWVNELFVVPKFRGWGIGNALMRKALPIIQNKQKKVARIRVIEDNVPMLRIQDQLLKEGFYQSKKKLDFRLKYYGDGRLLRYFEFKGVARTRRKT